MVRKQGFKALAEPWSLPTGIIAEGARARLLFTLQFEGHRLLPSHREITVIAQSAMWPCTGLRSQPYLTRIGRPDGRNALVVRYTEIQCRSH